MRRFTKTPNFIADAPVGGLAMVGSTCDKLRWTPLGMIRVPTPMVQMETSSDGSQLSSSAAMPWGLSPLADLIARTLLLFAMAVLLATVLVPTAMAQANPHWKDWHSVSRVKGVATIQEEDQNSQFGGSLVSQAVNSVTYTFTFETDTPGSAEAWEGSDVVVAGEHHGRTVEGPDVRTVDASYERPLAPGRGTNGFSAHSAGSGAGTWGFSSGQYLMTPYEETTTNESGTTVAVRNSDRSIYLQGRLDDATADGGPGLLKAEAVTQQDGGPENENPNFHQRVVTKLRLWPDYDDVVLEVRIPGYADWRPLGSIEDPKSFGSTLTITAELKSKDPAVKIFMKPRSFQFSLIDTSREPGVCMNWPLDPNDRDPDMRLRPYPGTHGGLDAEGQKLMVDALAPDATSPNMAKAFLDSFDFGGRSELQVTATLDDGRTIVGTLVDAGGNQSIISLPKSKVPGGWIAQSWRRKNHVENLSDSDDSEGDPKGDGNPGDGYTLYEEYRGFVENGKRVEADPRKKDFFIQNMIGADAGDGISLFQKLSGLKIHGKLTGEEMSITSRLMNANHRDAPHRVYQHGVWMATAKKGESGNGGLTEYDDDADQSKRLKPGTTRGIFIIGRRDPNSNFIHPYNNTSWGQSVAYTKTVAHELSHSVSVAHHGAGDRWEKLFFAPPGTTRNPDPAGKVGYRHDGAAALDTVLLEDNTDVSSIDYPVYLAQLAKYNAQFNRSPAGAAWLSALSASIAAQAAQVGSPDPGTAPQGSVEMQKQINANIVASRFDKILILGVKEGESSGDQDCIMRYRYANSYNRRGDASTFYLTAKGTEPVGLQMCQAATGTGINAPDRNTPQPRFFDAANGRGNCAGQVSPNDAVPPPAW